MKALFVSAAVFLLLLPEVARSQPQSARQIIAVRTTRVPVMDGKLDDPAWTAAKESDGFALIETTAERPDAPTYVKALTDGKALYVGFRCVEPDVKRIKAQTRDRDISVWVDDSVEIILDPANERRTVFHLIVNAAGSQYDAIGAVTGPEYVRENDMWNGDWEVKTSVGSGSWYVEARIPFETFGVNPETNPCLGINFARARVGGASEMSSWSPTRRLFVNPACLGELVIPARDGSYCTLDFPMLTKLFLGQQVLDFAVKNRSASPVRARYVYRLAGDKETSGRSDPFTIPAMGSRKVSLPINPTDSGWYRLSLRLEDADSGRILCGLSRAVELPPMLRLSESLYTLYQKKARADIAVNMASAQLLGTEMDIALLKEGTPRPIAVRKVHPPFADPVRAEFDLAGHTKGIYRIKADVRLGSAVLASAESHPMPYDPKPKIGFDKYGFLTVDGKPFFPVGIYTLQDRGGNHDKVMAAAREAGFNTTVFYALTTETVRPLLDAAERNGIKAFVYPVMPVSLQTGKETQAEFVRDVKAKMDHPALLGWYVVDEPEGQGKGRVDVTRDLYQLIKQTDTDHPCSIVIMSPGAAADYQWCTDVMWTDPYPVPHSPVTWVSDCTAGAVKAMSDGKPVWVVPQAFDWNVWNSGKIDKVHRPTPAEERCMTYLALVHGAKGIIYWAHTASKYYIEDYPEHWAYVKKMAGEMRDLSSILLTPDSKIAVTVSPKKSPIDTMVKEVGGRVYLFAVNHETSACKASFRLGGASTNGAVEVVFEGRSVRASSGAWTDEFKPLEVHVYRLRGRG